MLYWLFCFKYLNKLKVKDSKQWMIWTHCLNPFTLQNMNKKTVFSLILNANHVSIEGKGNK